MTTPTASPVSPTYALPEQHSVAQAILWHVAPGALIAAVFVATAPVAQRWGLPPFMAQCFADLVVLVAGVLGYLLYQGYRKNGRLSLDGVVFYRERLPWWQFAGLVLAVLVASGTLTALLRPTGTALFNAFFAWVPETLLPTTDLSPYSQSTLIASYLVYFVMISLTASIVEEFYFRGYLLPRLARFGLWAPVIQSVLFALYHVWSPWLIIVRIIGALPMIAAVHWKRNLYVSVVVHVVGNSVEALEGAAYILRRF